VLFVGTLPLFPPPSKRKSNISAYPSLHKEIGSYEKEAAKQQAKVQELEEKEACSHDIAQQKKVLQESVDMIPDTKRRLGIAVEELEEMVVRRISS